jgi:hypothetical protein
MRPEDALEHPDARVVQLSEHQSISASFPLSAPEPVVDCDEMRRFPKDFEPEPIFLRVFGEAMLDDPLRLSSDELIAAALGAKRGSSSSELESIAGRVFEETFQWF